MDSRVTLIAPGDVISISDFTEEQLLTAAARYDDAAIGELYDRHEAKIYAYVYRRTGEQTLAED